jgi:hypothetical protein
MSYQYLELACCSHLQCLWSPRRVDCIDPEDWGSNILQNVSNINQLTKHHRPEDFNHQQYCDNLKFCTVLICCLSYLYFTHNLYQIHVIFRYVFITHFCVNWLNTVQRTEVTHHMTNADIHITRKLKNVCMNALVARLLHYITSVSNFLICTLIINYFVMTTCLNITSFDHVVKIGKSFFTMFTLQKYNIF